MLRMNMTTPHRTGDGRPSSQNMSPPPTASIRLVTSVAYRFAYTESTTRVNTWSASSLVVGERGLAGQFVGDEDQRPEDEEEDQDGRESGRQPRPADVPGDALVQRPRDDR